MNAIWTRHPKSGARRPVKQRVEVLGHTPSGSVAIGWLRRGRPVVRFVAGENVEILT